MTIQDLEVWLEENCYNLNFITVGRHHAPEGEIFEFSGGQYLHAYSERGHKRIIRTFRTEEELVEYARNLLQEDKWAKAHIVAFVHEESIIKQVEELLKHRKIPFERNDIPDYQGQRIYRIFVFGRDVLKCKRIMKKYLKY